MLTNKEMAAALEAVLAALPFFEAPDLYIDLHVTQALKDVKAALESEPLAVVEKWLHMPWATSPSAFFISLMNEPHRNSDGTICEKCRPVTVTMTKRTEGSHDEG